MVSGDASEFRSEARDQMSELEGPCRIPVHKNEWLTVAFVHVMHGMSGLGSEVPALEWKHAVRHPGRTVHRCLLMRQDLILYSRCLSGIQAVPRSGFHRNYLAGRDSAKSIARSSHAVSLGSDSIPAGSTSAHPFRILPFMSAGLACGSASVSL